MEITELRGFLAVAREGHLTRASKALHITQPALSAQIARLEHSVGARLFDRSRSGSTLTPAGEVFLGYAQAALGALEDGVEALRRLEGAEVGQLRLGAGATATHYLLPRLLAQLRESHPGVEIYVREAGSQTIVEEVLSGNLDLGIVTLPVQDGRDAARLTVRSWRRDRLRLLVPPGHALEGQELFEWTALDGQDMVMFQAGTAVRNRIDAALAHHRVQPNVVMELRSIASIKRMVEAGVGAAFISEAALIDHPSLSPPDPIERTLAFVARRNRTQPPIATRFIQLALHSDPLTSA